MKVDFNKSQNAILESDIYTETFTLLQKSQI